jgi:ribonuclease HII
MDQFLDEDYLNQVLKMKGSYLAGCDEVGRGPLAGPVVAASAVLFLKDSGANKNTLKKEFKGTVNFLKELGVNDSKKLNEKKRRLILDQLGFGKKIKKSEEIECCESKNLVLKVSISKISHIKIDQINILNASLLGMKKSLYQLLERPKETPGILLVDGKFIPSNLHPPILAIPLIKGDSKSLLIGLASIVAKTYRDDLMKRFDLQYPGYGFTQNAGYPTKGHREAISELGVTKIHRKSFGGVKEWL